MWRPLVLVLFILVLAGCRGTGGGKAATDPFFGRTRVEPPRTGAATGQTPPTGTTWPNAATGQATPGGGPAIAWPTPSGTQSGAPAQVAPGQSSWTPAQSRPGGVAAPITSQANNGLTPPDGTFGFSGGTGNPAAYPTAAGSGDRIAIPSAARTLTDRVQDSISRSQSLAPPGQVTTSGGQPFAGSGTRFGASPTASIPGVPASTGSAGGLPGAGLNGREKVVRVIEPGPSATNGTQSYSPYPSNATPSSTGAQGPSGSDKPVNIADLPEAGS
jgi:hypothetical protein